VERVTHAVLSSDIPLSESSGNIAIPIDRVPLLSREFFGPLAIPWMEIHANFEGGQGLKPLFFRRLNVAAEAATHKDHLRDSLWALPQFLSSMLVLKSMSVIG